MFLTTTTDVIRLITDVSCTVDVHVSYADTPTSGTSTISVGSNNTAITTATTTTVCSSPASSTTRNVVKMIVRNKSTTNTVTVTTQLYNGTAYELDKRVLGPGGSFQYVEKLGFNTLPTGGPLTRPWFGNLAAAYGDGDPGELMLETQRAGNVAPTPTNITTSIARCSAFMLPFDFTFNRIRAYGIGAVTSTYSVAVYRFSDLARMTSALTFTTVANTWVSIGSALACALSKDTPYFIACAVVTTGTTAGLAAFGATTTATTGQIQQAPSALPGNMALGAGNNYLGHYQFQFAVTTGALPNPAATLAAASAWTGGMPAFWLDAADV